MMDYKNGKIYKLVNDVNDIIYIGSTTQPLYKRFDWHKRRSRNESGKKVKLYRAISEIGIDHFKIVLIEEYPCENRQQLFARETEMIIRFDSIKNGYNMIKSYVSDEEYAEWLKKYKISNKDYFSSIAKEHHKNNREILLSKMKEYYINNREKKLEYYKNNKENILIKNKEYGKEMIKCTHCDIEIYRYCYYKHIKTTKHLLNKVYPFIE